MFLFSKWSKAVGVGVFNSAKDLGAALNSPYQKVEDEALVEGQGVKHLKALAFLFLKGPLLLPSFFE